MSRSRRTVRAAGLAVAFACAALVACSAFDLGDVVSNSDEGNGDGSANDGDAASDAGSSADGPGPCVPGGDPCNCLEAPLTISPPPNGTGGTIAVIGDTVYFTLTAVGGSGSNPLMVSAPITGLGDGGTLTHVIKVSPIGSDFVIGQSWFYFRYVAAPVAVAFAPVSSVNANVSSYFGPLVHTPGDMTVDSTRIIFGGSDGAICAIPIGADAGPVGVDDAGCGGAIVVPPRAGGPNTFQVAANDTTVYQSANGHIYDAPQSTGVLSQLLVHPNASFGGMTDDRGRLFWAEVTGDAGSLWSADDRDGAASDIVPSALDGALLAATFTVDADGIYWSQFSYTKIWAAARDGSKRTLVACEPGVASIATDANFIYWLTSNGGVRRIAKPPLK